MFYNQDALAVLVAAEMKKVLQKELAPVAPPKLVDAQPLLDDIEALQVCDRKFRWHYQAYISYLHLLAISVQVEAEPDDEDENEIHLDDIIDADAEDSGQVYKNQKSGEKKLTKDRNR